MNRKRALTLGIALGAGMGLVARALRSARAVSFAHNIVLIFGGSRGLGLVLARELAAEGATVILAARQVDELERARDELTASGAGVTIIPCAPHAPGRRQAHRQYLVNRREDRHAASVPYSASKFALTGLSEGLRAELARDGIRVTTVCPGLMRTGSTYNAWFKGQHRREFAWFHIADSIPGISIGAGRAARQIIDACRHGDAELIITPGARLAVLLNAACPGTMAKAMAIANRLLPSPAEHGGDEAQSGWQSISRFVPSTLTTLADRASLANNEVPLVESGQE